jgi:glycosyltransferase involved in cell wall biosynthesis
MKLLFIHETKIKQDKAGTLYTGGSYNQDVWNRYLSISTDFRILARKEATMYEIDDAKKRFNYLNHEKIKFTEIPDYVSSIKTYLNIGKRVELNNIIKTEVYNSDCLIIRLPSGSGNIAIKYAEKFKKPYLVEVVGCAWDTLWNHSIKGKILAPLSYFNMKKAVINAPYAIYVSKDFLQKRYPCKGKWLGCSDVSLQPQDDRLLEERLYKIEQLQRNKPIIIGTIAGVNLRYKGQQYVIEAISRLNKQGYNFEYILVGGGDKEYLKLITKKYNIEDKVKFLGSLPHNKVFEFIRNIDIYIQPSNAESHGRVIVEAMSCACPVIGSSTGGIPELVSKDFVFRRKNVDDLVIKIKKMTNKMMEIEAKRNYEKAKEFDYLILNKKRNEFYSMFKNGE